VVCRSVVCTPVISGGNKRSRHDPISDGGCANRRRFGCRVAHLQSSVHRPSLVQIRYQPGRTGGGEGPYSHVCDGGTLNQSQPTYRRVPPYTEAGFHCPNSTSRSPDGITLRCRPHSSAYSQKGGKSLEETGVPKAGSLIRLVSPNQTRANDTPL